MGFCLTLVFEVCEFGFLDLDCCLQRFCLGLLGLLCLLIDADGVLL